MVPVLKEMERSQMLGCIIQAELHQGSAVWQKVHGSPEMLSSTGIKGRKQPPPLSALPLPPCTTQNNTPHTSHCTAQAAQHCQCLSFRHIHKNNYKKCWDAGKFAFIFTACSFCLCSFLLMPLPRRKPKLVK